MRRKLYAMDAFPARCRGCDGLSYVGVSLRHMLLLLLPELAAILLVVGWSTNRLLGVVGLILLLAVMVSYQRLAPLVRISAGRARLARWAYSIAWLLILGLIALASLRSTEDLL